MRPAHCECPVESHPPHFRAEKLHKLLVILQGLLSPALSGPSSSLFSVVSCYCPSHKANPKAGPPVPLAPGTSGARPCSRAFCCSWFLLASGQGPPPTLSCQFLPAFPPWLAASTPTGPQGVPTESFRTQLQKPSVALGTANLPEVPPPPECDCNAN